MCGVAGLWSVKGVPAEQLAAAARAMTDTLTHRGPDDSGIWIDLNRGLALGQRRLSIQDLSPEGRQPMLSASQRYVISFNGEVYNYAELRDEIEKSRGVRLATRGHSDTEIMLTAIEEWGLVDAVSRFVGMFAFALWDRERRTLSLVRDRLGIKPLYFGFSDGGLVFGSELKALVAHSGFSKVIDRSALTSYLRFGYVPAPQSIYARAQKVEPGSISEFSAPNTESRRCISYWSSTDVARRGIANPFAGTARDAVDELDRRLTDAVKLRLVSDVPIGAFLSGGIDSSTVVALMRRAAGSTIRTFSIGNETAAFDESSAAAAVARHLDTVHTALTVTAAEARAVIPFLPRMYDEPFADSSQIPTFLVSRLARQHVTVALSGDGGDEVFGGYNRHVWGTPVWRLLGHLPRRFRTGFARATTVVPSRIWDAAFGRQSFLPAIRMPAAKLEKLMRILDSESQDELYLRLASIWENPTELVPDTRDAVEPLPELGGTGTEAMMLRDLVTYLPNDILTKVDRASMAVALEARVPLLDHRVLEFAWSLPLKFKVRGLTGKWILRQVLSRYVPAALFDRAKMGFAVPIASWLRGPLREWAGDLLGPDSLRRFGHLKPEPVQRIWSEHLSGERNNEQKLWAVLMLQAWSAEWTS